MNVEPKHEWLAMFQVHAGMNMPEIGRCIGILMTPPMAFVILGAILSAVNRPETPPSAAAAMVSLGKDLLQCPDIREFAANDENGRTFYNRFAEMFGSIKLTGEN